MACIAISLVPSAAAAAVSSLSERDLAERIDRFARKAGGVTGVYVHDLGSEAKLYGRRAGRDFVLASNTKLFTTAAALDRFGPDHRLATTVHLDGRIEGRRLRGDLYLVGDGDPTLADGSFSRAGIPRTSLNPLVRAVRETGIRKISGRLIADDTVFDRIRGVPYSNWGPTDELRGPLGGLTYNAGWAAGDPAIAAAKAFRKKLRRKGLKIKRVKVGALPDRLRSDALGAAQSPRMARIVAQTNRVSDNTFAEMLLKRIAARPGQRKGTTRKGAKIAERVAARVGSGAHLADGSGLSSGNRASPEQVVALLDGIEAEPGFPAFWNSLPKAGSQGTLADRMGGTVAAGRCRAKTGTLNGVTTLSGYCTTKPSKRRVAFSILMNGIDVTRGRAYQDRIVKTIARLR